MQRVAWRLVVMLWAANTGLALGPPRSNGYADFSGTVIVSLPHKMFVDIPNRIIIQSDNPILKVTINMTIYKFLTLNAGLTTFDQLDGNKSAIEEKYTYDLMYCVPIELKPGSHFNLQIVYFHCPSKNCRNGDRLIQKSVTKSVQLVQQFTVIMGETDKPLYRPGEEVRFRLIALTNRHILPHSESPTWPTYEAVGEFSEEQTLRRIEPTEREKRMRAPHFDSIEVRDPHSNIVYQWKHVKSSDALHLAFKLISDAKEGEWKIEVHVRHQKEVMPFTVRHYILPRFRAHLKLPDGIEPTDPDVKFGICAAYANGPFIRGTFDAQICICDGSVLERQQVEGKMFSKNKCISSYNTIMRTCMRTTGILDGASCASFAVNMLQLVNNESVRWNERIGVFVEAVEEGTTSSVFTSEVTKFRRWKEPQIDLILPSNYRNGLPLVGQVVYKNSVNATGDALEVVVNEILDACYYGLGTIDERQINLIKIPVKPGLETYDFTIPPLDLENPIRVTVRQVRGVDYPGENLLPPTGIRRFNPPRLNLRATKRLHLWDDEKGFAIQVILMNATSITCPGNVRLQILSNRALPKSTTLALQFLSRGRLAMKKLKLKVDYLCTPKKNEVEHYNYSEGGDSRCHEFVYDGNGCQGDGMNAGSGWCSTMPGEKDAPPGKKANHEERRNAVSVPRKTFFKYKATLELNGESGPEFRAVAYVFRGNQMASDYIKIGGLQGCSSPMMAETKHKGGFQFNKRFAVPGENVSIFLKLVPGKEDNVDAANLCLLSITDTSSKQFGLADFHRIDLDSFSALLTGDQVYGSEAEVRGTKDAYRAAGMDFIPISPISKMQTPRHCPRMIYPTYAASRIPPMGRIGPMGSPGVHRSEFVIGDTIHHRKQNSVVIPRIRDFFPEVWLFETAKLTNASLTKSLTVPDALTKWEANAVCLTVRRGLWMPMKKSQLTVWMPFFVEFTPPLMARRGEVLHLRISVFVHPEINTSATMVVMKTGTKAAHDLVIGAENGGGGEGVPRTCYEVEVAMETDQRDWQVVGASTFTTCICMGDLKKTFYPTLRPLRIGHLNVTAKAVARRGNWKCSDDGDVFGDWRQAPEALTVTDAARRSVRVIAEGVEKYFTLGGAFCAFKGK